MRSYQGFIKASRRGSVYYSTVGKCWIKKIDSKWHLIQMGGEGIKPVTVAEFKTLANAARYYREVIL